MNPSELKAVDHRQDVYSLLAGGVSLVPGDLTVDASIAQLAAELAVLWDFDIGLDPPAAVFFAGEGWSEAPR